MIVEGDLTAIKLHFGQFGSDEYINPVFVRWVVEKIKEFTGILRFGMGKKAMEPFKKMR